MLAYTHVNGSADHENEKKNWSDSGTNGKSSWASNILFIGEHEAFNNNNKTEARHLSMILL